MADAIAHAISAKFRWHQLNHLNGVYVVGMCGYIKIGWSGTSIGQRLRQIEDGTPEDLVIYRVLPGRDIQDERRLHRRFSAYRRKREWFACEGGLKDFAGTIPYIASDLPFVRSKAVALLVREDGLSDALDALPGPPTLYQRYLQLIDMGGGVLCDFRPG